PEIVEQPRPITATGHPKYGPFVGDRRAIFFTEHENNRFQISWVDPRSATVGRLRTELPSAAVAGMSPDKLTLLVRGPLADYHSDAPLSVLSRDGGLSHSLNITGFDGDWVPDGKSLVYSTGNELRQL